MDEPPPVDWDYRGAAGPALWRADLAQFRRGVWIRLLVAAYSIVGTVVVVAALHRWFGAGVAMAAAVPLGAFTAVAAWWLTKGRRVALARARRVDPAVDVVLSTLSGLVYFDADGFYIETYGDWRPYVDARWTYCDVVHHRDEDSRLFVVAERPGRPGLVANSRRIHVPARWSDTHTQLVKARMNVAA